MKKLSAFASLRENFPLPNALLAPGAARVWWRRTSHDAKRRRREGRGTAGDAEFGVGSAVYWKGRYFPLTTDYDFWPAKFAHLFGNLRDSFGAGADPHFKVAAGGKR